MKITVRFAGYYRSLAEVSLLELELAGGATVVDALAVLDERLEGRCHKLFYGEGGQSAHPDLLILVDTRIAQREEVLQEGQVMALVPPMAGG